MRQSKGIFLSATLVFGVFLLGTQVAQVGADTDSVDCGSLGEEWANAQDIFVEAEQGTIELVVDQPGTADKRNNGQGESRRIKIDSQSNCAPGQLKKLLESVESESDAMIAADCSLLDATVKEFDDHLGNRGATEVEVDWATESPESLERIPTLPPGLDRGEARRVLRETCK